MEEGGGVKMIKIKVIFFASFKEKLDCGEVELSLKENSTVANLCESLAEMGDAWQALFALANKNVKVACNQQMVEMSTCLNDGDEVAFFPPVTGG